MLLRFRQKEEIKVNVIRQICYIKSKNLMYKLERGFSFMNSMIKGNSQGNIFAPFVHAKKAVVTWQTKMYSTVSAWF